MNTKLFDKNIRNIYYKKVAFITATLSVLFIFFKIPDGWEIIAFCAFILLLGIVYICTYIKWKNPQSITLKITDTDVEVLFGDLFNQEDFKVIAFNEYFDTIVDDKIIAHASLNGQYIKKEVANVEELDKYISNYIDTKNMIEENDKRKNGKKIKYELGTLVLREEFILTSFSKFDDDNRAYIYMIDYIKFLLKFWDELNKVYAMKTVNVPILGSGITRFKNNPNVAEEELLHIMLWTFEISKLKFEFPAKIKIIVSESKKDRVNLLKYKENYN